MARNKKQNQYFVFIMANGDAVKYVPEYKPRLKLTAIQLMAGLIDESTQDEVLPMLRLSDSVCVNLNHIVQINKI